MINLKQLLLTIFTSAILSGCAGTDFKRPDPQALSIGKSTTADVTRVLGTPGRTGEALKNEQKIKTTTYVYAVSGGEAQYAEVIPARALIFSTFNDVLVGQEFLSSFKVDSTEFDESKVKDIAKGKTNRAEVEALLGKPPGEVIYPLIKVRDEKASVYNYSQTKGTAFNLKFFSKQLVVTFDAAGIVSDVAYSSSGEK